MAFRNFHFPSIPAPKTVILEQYEGLHEAQPLNGCIVLLKLVTCQRRLVAHRWSCPVHTRPGMVMPVE